VIEFEEGRYRVKVTGQQLGRTEAGKLELCFTIEPLVQFAQGNAGQDYDVSGMGTRTVRFYFVSEENTRISVETLRALGWEGTTFGSLADGTWDLTGRELPARCEHETYSTADSEERSTERWSFITQRPRQLAAVEDGTLAELDARFGHVLAAVRPANTPAKAPPPKAEAPAPQQQPKRRPPTKKPTANGTPDVIPF
jgi:hypothetical protein